MSDPTDAWVCRIPRPVLHKLATDPGVHRRERVLLALLAEFHSHRVAGPSAVSLSRLERLTGLHRSTVRRAIGELDAAGIVDITEAKAGRIRHIGLAGCAPSAHPAQMGDTEGVLQGDTKGAQMGDTHIKNGSKGIVLKEQGGKKFARYDKREADRYAFGKDGLPVGVGEPIEEMAS